MPPDILPPIAEHIIDVAGGLFYREGINAVGIDRIIREADVAKATMYRHFESKDDLIAACLTRRHAAVVAALQDGLRRSRAKGIDKVLTIFDLLAVKARSDTFRGCAFMIATAESGGSETVRKIAREHKDAVRAIFSGLLPVTWSHRDKVSARLNLLYDGALAQILIYQDDGAVRTARDCAKVILEDAARTA